MTPITSPINRPTLAPDTHRTSQHPMLRLDVAVTERRWWQFELRPWHYLVSTSATVLVAGALLVVLLTHGAAAR